MLTGGGGSDANILNARGLPTVNLDAGMMQVHSPDEYVTLDDLERLCAAGAAADPAGSRVRATGAGGAAGDDDERRRVRRSGGRTTDAHPRGRLAPAMVYEGKIVSLRVDEIALPGGRHGHPRGGRASRGRGGDRAGRRRR